MDHESLCGKHAEGPRGTALLVCRSSAPGGLSACRFLCNVSHDPGTETFYENEALWSEHRAEEIGVPFGFVRSNTYIGNGKDRFRNMWGFYRNGSEGPIC